MPAKDMQQKPRRRGRTRALPREPFLVERVYLPDPARQLAALALVLGTPIREDVGEKAA